jgi:hypothetical protein
MNPDVAPVAVDLTAVSNIDPFNNITTSYTNAAPSPTRVQVSDQDTVTLGGVTAANTAFAQMIGTINFFKRNNPANPVAVPPNPGDITLVESTRKQAIKSFDGLMIENGFSLQRLKIAGEFNGREQLLAQDLEQDVFTKDPAAAIVEYRDSLEAYLAAIAILKDLRSTFYRIVDLIAASV